MFKKILAALMCLLMLSGVAALPVSAVSIDEGVEQLRSQFLYGEGPETDGYTIDYRYFSPVKEKDSTKYPLVVWLHGMGDGEYEGKQISMNNMPYWTSEEYQSRFKNSGGAFIFAPRSLEEKDLYWDDCLIYPLRAAIDDFISKNEENIDISRIYVGGYSMGGRMTYKMAVAYPEMFAAAFPICPAWCPSEKACEKIADMPIWLTSGKTDILVNYQAMVTPGWNNLCKMTNVPENCRFSSLTITAYANGLPASSHYAWYAVNNDMFSAGNGDYPYMNTVNANGEKVEITYPDGMISWLSAFSSDYDGSSATDIGNEEAKGGAVSLSLSDIILAYIKSFIAKIKAFFGLL